MGESIYFEYRLGYLTVRRYRWLINEIIETILKGAVGLVLILWAFLLNILAMSKEIQFCRSEENFENEKCNVILFYESKSSKKYSIFLVPGVRLFWIIVNAIATMWKLLKNVTSFIPITIYARSGDYSFLFISSSQKLLVSNFEIHETWKSCSRIVLCNANETQRNLSVQVASDKWNACTFYFWYR